MKWIYDIPTWELGFLIVGPTLLVSSLVLILRRNWIYRHFRLANDTNDGINGFFSAMGMLYGILLGLVAISAWENMGYVETIASKEATSIIQLYRSVSTLDEPMKSQQHHDLEDYLKYVIYVAWPAHKLGEVPEGGSIILTQFLARLSTYHTRNVEQQIFLAEVISSYKSLIEDRRVRMHYVLDSGIGSIIWVVILVGGVLTLSCSFLIHLPTLGGHLFVNSLFSLLLSLMIFLIAAIDQPFRGELGVTPHAYSSTLSVLHILAHTNTNTITPS